jgi:choline dehydrogenase-like flavoprotein
MTNHFDVIIIGTGAGGGTMLQALALSGKRILVLERGEFLPRERANWDTKAVFADKRYQANETWHHGGKPFRPEIHYWMGGNTKMFGAAGGSGDCARVRTKWCECGDPSQQFARGGRGCSGGSSSARCKYILFKI